MEKNAYVLELNNCRSRRMFAFVATAMSRDDSRKILCGVYVDRDFTDGCARLVASDGRRLHVARWDEGSLGPLPPQGQYSVRSLEHGMWLLQPDKSGVKYPAYAAVDTGVKWCDMPYTEDNRMIRERDQLLYWFARRGAALNPNYLSDATACDERAEVCARQAMVRLSGFEGCAHALLMTLRLWDGDADLPDFEDGHAEAVQAPGGEERGEL